jgi:CheY-like chemotaxis protein
VYDTGPGISPAHQQRIFNDFYRVSGNIEGAGLGLGIALRFANLLSHTISLHSQETKGSLFSLRVPRAEGQQNICTQQPIAHTPSGLDGLTIFYLDDDENNIHALGTMLENWGCVLSSAQNVVSARLYLTDSTRPDVLLMDYQLGTDLNGMQMAQEIRQRWHDIPVCIVSAAPDNDLAALANSLGCDFLRKPIKPNKLRALLEKYQQRNKFMFRN